MTCDGMIAVDKPASVTSHDVVDRIRRLVGRRRVGHTGTLDPMATGLLLVCLGRATRLARFLQDTTKTYRGRFQLGISTDTLDSEGTQTRREPCEVTREQVASQMHGLVGSLEQTPPMVSAVKVRGRKLYEMARRGEDVARPSRTITVNRFELTEFEPGPFPTVGFEVTCSKGTYVRCLAADIGERLGCGAYLTELCRTQSGEYTLDDAHTLTDLEKADAEQLCAMIIPIHDIKTGLPSVQITDAALSSVTAGRSLTRSDYAGERPIAVSGPFAVRHHDRLLAVYQADGDEIGRAKSVCVLTSASEDETR